jgi:predicted  nucleic acid-binding Zn-ribbon protein
VLIDRNQGSSVALEATPARMEASKRMMNLTPFQKNMQLAKDNAALRAEMARFQRQESANTYFVKEIKEAMEILQQAVFEWRKAQKDIDNEFSQNTSDRSTETGKIQIGIDRFK